MSRIALLIGNGFSIDLVKTLKIEDKINLSNLFAQGENVLWPADDKPPFLSYKHCPNLWTLGAKPNIDAVSATELIQEIITCANLFQQITISEKKIHIDAYKELESYLMSLFISYTRLADIPSLGDAELKDWGWRKYLEKVRDDKGVEHVDVISLNYDIWLEQLLKNWSIDYSVAAFEPDSHKFRIYKPHGSIGFRSKKRMDKAAYAINYLNKSIDLSTDEFEIDLSSLDGLNMTNAMIPPAGDSTRFSLQWAKDQKNLAEESIKALRKGDKLIICGVSYWPVDRNEIDTYLVNVSSEVDVYMINPNPPKDLVAVLMTLFSKLSIFSNSNNLVKI